MKKIGAVVGVVLIGIAVGALWFMRASGPPAAEQPAAAPPPAAENTAAVPSPTSRTGKTPADRTETPAARSSPAGDAAPDKDTTQTPTATDAVPTPPAPNDFCERDFSDSAARRADADALAAAGGLVHIFEREAQRADVYGCADFYLAHGLDIDAVDPRAGHKPLTGLFYAIRRNDPKMLRFMIEHGADLKKRAGQKNIKAMGYAYYLAFNDTEINRNPVIGVLDKALAAQSKAADR